MSSDSGHDQILQAWVERGRKFSQRAAKLSSAWNANYVNALSEYASVNDMQPNILPSSKPGRLALPSRVTITRNQATRASVRALRQQRLARVARAEREKAEMEERKRQEELEKQARVKEQMERQRQQAEQQQRAAEQQRQRQQAEEEQRRMDAERRKKEEADDRAAREKKAAADEQQRQRELQLKQQREEERRKRIPKSDDPQFNAKYDAWLKGPGQDWLDDPSQLSPSKQDDALVDITNCITTCRQVAQKAELFRKDPSAKRVRLAAKRVITRAINQSSGTVEQVRMKIMEILKALHELETSSGNSSDLAQAFGIYEFSTQILLEANNSIAGNQELAYGLAAIVVGVSSGYPNYQVMRNVILGSIYVKSIISRPHFPTRNKNESLPEFRLRLGYKDDGDNEKEKDEEFVYRQRAYIHLIAAIFQTNIKMLQLDSSYIRNPNPFPITMAWTWIARIVNRRQRTLTPEVIYAFLETAGYAMSKAFGEQFAKLISMVKKSVIEHASPYASALSISNMKAMIAEFEQNGYKFKEPPKGRELPLQDSKNT